jgi:hypothetical protein
MRDEAGLEEADQLGETRKVGRRRQEREESCRSTQARRRGRRREAE